MIRSTPSQRRSGAPTRLRASVLALAGTALLLTGCYSYVPVEPQVVPPGEHVRLVVTREGGAELARLTGREEALPQISGRLLGEENRTLLLRVPVSSGFDGASHLQLGQVIRIPVGEVLVLERRELNRGRTAALIGGVGAAGIFLVYQVTSSGGGSRMNLGEQPELIFIPGGSR